MGICYLAFSRLADFNWIHLRFGSIIRAVWKMTRAWYGPEFMAFMDTIAQKSSTRLGMDLLAQWKLVVGGS